MEVLKRKSLLIILSLHAKQLSMHVSHKLSPFQKTKFRSHLVTSKPLSVNFLRYKKGNRIAIPVDYVNSEFSEAKKRNCTFIAVNSSIECICADEIPRVLKLDLSNAQKGDIYRLNAVEFPPKVRPSKTISPDTVICSVKAR